ncbi:MAG: flagellar basal body P-ring formation chaperone FlgA [Phycisphaerales bacterium]
MSIQPSRLVLAACLAGCMGFVAPVHAAPAERADSAISPAMLGQARGSVRLRHSVRLAPGRDRIRVGDIAFIDGPDAKVLATIDLGPIDADAGAQHVKLEAVRAALNAAGVHPARVSLRGRSARVLPGGVATRSHAPSAMTGRRIVNGRVVDVADVQTQEDDAPATAPTRDAEREAARDARFTPAAALLAETVETATVRGEIARDLARTFRVGPNTLRIAFPDGKAALLDSSVRGGSIIVRRRSKAVAGAVSYAVISRRAGDSPRTELVLVNPEIRSAELVLTERVRSGTTLTAEHLLQQEAWMPPGGISAPARLAATLGAKLRRSMNAGTVLRERDLRMTELIKRGDLIQIRCITPGIKIEQRGEARERGHLGAKIRVRRVGEREEFIAVVVGPGLAEVDLRNVNPGS